MTLTWTDNAGNETGFTIQRATNLGFTAGLTTNNVAANTTTFNTGNIALNTTYYFRVQAFNEGGASTWSFRPTRRSARQQGPYARAIISLRRKTRPPRQRRAASTIHNAAPSSSTSSRLKYITPAAWPTTSITMGRTTTPPI